MTAGRLEVICGPMFSGKTEELIRRLRRDEIAGRSVIIFKPTIDVRYDELSVVSHNGTKIDAAILAPDGLVDFRGQDYDTIGVDEVQFFEQDMVTGIRLLLHMHKKIIVAGLDADFRRKPFGIVPQLIALCDKLDKLTAICHKCGEEAIFTQRLVDNEPAPFDGPTVLVGAIESYEARCRKCYQEG